MRAQRRHASTALLAALVSLLAAGCATPADSANGMDATDPPSQNVVTPAAPSVVAAPPTPASADVTTSHGSGRVSSAAEAPVVVTFELDDAKALFGEGARATITIESMRTQRLRAGVALPAGVAWVGDDASYEGAADAGAPIRLEGILRAGAPGEIVLRAWAEASVAAGSRVAPSVLLGVSGSAESARFFAPTAPAPSFQLTLAPASGDAARAVATIASNASANARLVWIVPQAFGAAAGVHEEALALVAGQTQQRAIELGAAEPWEGFVTIDAYVYPDAALDGRLYRDALYAWWVEGELRVAQTPPGASDGGSSAGPATGP